MSGGGAKAAPLNVERMDMVTIANAPRHEPNPYRTLRTDDLLRERELVSWDLADLDVDPDSWDYPVESVAYLEYMAGLMDRELNRRRKVRTSIKAPSWRTPDPTDRAAEWAEIRRRTDLVELIHQITPVRLRKAGREYVGKCPFPDHDDNSPSFSVNPDKQVFHCFGCQRGGDVFTFAQQFLGLDRVSAAADVLGTWAGIVPGALYVVDKDGNRVRVK